MNAPRGTLGGPADDRARLRLRRILRELAGNVAAAVALPRSSALAAGRVALAA